MNSSGLLAGVLGGLIGGVLFAFILAAIGMLPMIAGLAGSAQALVGAGVHFVISAVIGLIFALVLGTRHVNSTRGLAYGAGYGTLWWVLGPQIIMPLWLGTNMQFSQALSGPMLVSLAGHILYGLVLGAVYSALSSPAMTAAGAGD